jgi:hypothetical protein
VVKESYYAVARSLLEKDRRWFDRFTKLWTRKQLLRVYLYVDLFIRQKRIVRSNEFKRLEEAFFWAVFK